MTDRTCAFILCCKGHGPGGNDDIKKNIRTYMAETCACDPNAYTDRVIFDLILEATRDFCLQDPAAAQTFMLGFLEQSRTHIQRSQYLGIPTENPECLNLLDVYIDTLRFLQVKEGATYINGFTEPQLTTQQELLSSFTSTK